MEKPMFDFGFGPVAAHRHANGGGWVADSARVADTAYVGSEAQVYGKAQVCGEARVYGKALVCGGARVYGKARVTTTPLVISGLEYTITVCDNQVQIGCKTVPATAQLSADMFPEESCPILRACAHTLIPLIREHYTRAAQVEVSRD